MDAFRQLWRAAPGARPYFVAVAQGALGHGAGYVVLMVVAYERLGSAWAASLMLLADMLPSMVLGPLVGAWLDRRDRLRWAIAADAVRAGALAGMIVLPGPGPLLALALVMGLAGTVFRSASFSVLGHAVPEDRRMPATALYGALQDLGMTLGPALAAGMLVIGGPELLLAVNAGLFAASALLLSRVRLVRAEAAPPEVEESLFDGAREGLRLVWADQVLRVLVCGTGAIVLCAGMMNVAEVLLAQRDLGVGGAGFAAMVAVFGIGAVAGSTLSARSEGLTRMKLGYAGGLAVAGAGMLGSALAPSLAWALAAFLVTGIGNSVSMAHDRGLVQHLVPGRMLARVHALNGTVESWAFAGSALAGGAVATVLGARGVFAVGGAAVVLVAAVAALTLVRRPAAAPLPATA